MMAMAQTDRQHIRQGNKLYRQQKADKAEVDYRKAVDKNQQNPQALYNLGCALMAQQKDSAAVVQFQNAAKLEKSKLRKAMIYHNIGVICQQQQLFGDAIEAYKESLRNNPKDDETRYNLALCMRQQKNENKNQGGNDQDDKGDQNKKDQNEQQDKQQPKEDKQQQKKDQMSKENAEQLLQAAMQEEKNTQQKMKQQQAQPQQRRLQKNW